MADGSVINFHALDSSTWQSADILSYRSSQRRPRQNDKTTIEDSQHSSKTNMTVLLRISSAT